MILTKQVQVTKEADELVAGIVKMILALKKAGSDGFDISNDLPVIIQAVLQDLLPAIQGLDKLDDEASENWVALVNAFTLGAVELAGQLFKKGEVVHPIGG
jgi:hypothetical protein